MTPPKAFPPGEKVPRRGGCGHKNAECPVPNAECRTAPVGRGHDPAADPPSRRRYLVLLKPVGAGERVLEKGNMRRQEGQHREGKADQRKETDAHPSGQRAGPFAPEQLVF